MTKPTAPPHYDNATLTRLLSSDLSARKKRQVEAHLLTCPTCAKESEKITRLWNAAQTADRNPASTDAVRTAILHEITTQSERKPMFLAFFTTSRLLIGGAGAAAALSALWLAPGAPLRPLPAFAEVEAAMQNIETATWTESTVYGKPGMSDTNYYGAQLKPQPLLFYRGYSLWDHDPKGSLTLTNAYGTYSPPQTGQKNTEWTIVARGKNVREQIREKLLFSPGAGEQEKQRQRTARTSASYGYQWQWQPWTAERTTRNGKQILRYTSHSEVRRTDGLDGPHSADYTLYVDPETRLISRAETRTYRGTDRGTLSIKDSFRYNVPLTEDVDRSLPPANTPVNIADWEAVGPEAPRVPQREAEQAGQTLSAFADALSHSDSTQLSSLIDQETVSARPSLSTRAEQTRQTQLRQIASAPQKRTLWNTFRFPRIVEVHYTSRYRYTRAAQSAFPPAPAQTAYEIIAVASGTTRQGETLTCPARISLRRVGNTLKVAATAFYPTLPAADAEQWTSEAVQKSVQETVKQMLRSNTKGHTPTKTKPRRLDDGGVAG